MEGWRIYYGDGSTFDSSQGSWEEAPDDNVQFVLVFEEYPYRMPIYGFDEYRLPDSSGASSGAPKRGRWIPGEEFEAIRDKMMADMDWPKA